MDKKQLAKYGAVFAAGILSVFAVIGINSVVAPPTPSPQLSAEAESQLSPENTEEDYGQDKQGQVANDSSEQRTVENPAPNPEATSSSAWTAADVAGASRIKDLVRNTTVTIQGTVARATEEDEFILTDDSGSVQIYTGRTHFTVEQGDKVTVRGLVDEAAILEVYANEIVLEDGSVIKVRHWR